MNQRDLHLLRDGQFEQFPNFVEFFFLFCRRESEGRGREDGGYPSLRGSAYRPPMRREEEGGSWRGREEGRERVEEGESPPRRAPQGILKGEKGREREGERERGVSWEDERKPAVSRESEGEGWRREERGEMEGSPKPPRREGDDWRGSGDEERVWRREGGGRERGGFGGPRRGAWGREEGERDGWRRGEDGDRGGWRGRGGESDRSGGGWRGRDGERGGGGRWREGDSDRWRGQEGDDRGGPGAWRGGGRREGGFGGSWRGRDESDGGSGLRDKDPDGGGGGWRDRGRPHCYI